MNKSTTLVVMVLALVGCAQTSMPERYTRMAPLTDCNHPENYVRCEFKAGRWVNP